MALLFTETINNAQSCVHVSYIRAFAIFEDLTILLRSCRMFDRWDDPQGDAERLAH